MPAAKQHTVLGRYFGIWVGQNRVVQFQLLREVGVEFQAVATGGEVGDVERLDGFAVLTERLALRRSAPGEGLGEPGDHDGLLAFEV